MRGSLQNTIVILMTLRTAGIELSADQQKRSKEEGHGNPYGWILRAPLCVLTLSDDFTENLEALAFIDFNRVIFFI